MDDNAHEVQVILPSGATLDVQYTEELEAQVRHAYALEPDDEVTVEMIKCFFMSELASALESYEKED